MFFFSTRRRHRKYWRDWGSDMCSSDLGVRWLGRLKAAAARVNAELGLLDAELAQRIAAAADEIAEGRHDAQFPVDVFQTGSGTSSNMNDNEVIATLAGDGAHQNAPGNMGQ